MKLDQKVARSEISDRVEEAWDTLKRLPDRERGLLIARGQQWPVMLYTAAEHAAWKPMRSRRPPPTSRQIDRMHEVLGWLLELAKQNTDFFKAVWLCCAERKKPAEAAKVIGCHRETVRIWRDNGLARVAEIRTWRHVA